MATKYAIRNKRNPDEWQIFQPGGRLDHWGPECERAEFDSREQAEARMRAEFAFPDRVAEIIQVSGDAT